MSDRIEWPSGLANAEEMVAGAGRVEQQLNANGDPTYIGYAPRPDSPSHLPGWLVELRVYNGSNKLIGQYRTIAYSWNDRALLTKPAITPPPVFGQLRVSGTVRPGIYYKHGSASVQVQVNGLAVASWNIVNFAVAKVGQIAITAFRPYVNGAYVDGFLSTKYKYGIAVGAISTLHGMVKVVISDPVVLGQIRITALARANSLVRSYPGIQQIAIRAYVSATKV